ncbi:MAG: ABC transporter permease [Phycisphaerales bacterium]
MAVTSATIIKRSLTARMFSTVTTIITVAVAVALLLVLLSLGKAGSAAFQRGTGNMHLLVSRDTSRMVSVLNAIFYAAAPQRPIEWSKFKEIERTVIRDPRFRTNEFAIPIQQGDSYRGYAVTATTPEFFQFFSTDVEFIPEQAGRENADETSSAWKFTAGGTMQDLFDVVVGADVAASSGLKPGDEIYMTHGRADSPGAHVHDEYTWTVRGVLEPTGTAHDRAVFSMLESSWLVHARDFVEQAGGDINAVDIATLDDEYRKITGVLVRVATRPGRKTSSALGQVAYQLSQDAELVVASPADEVQALFRIVSNIDDILIGMAAVVMISSGIAIMLALYNSMEQRRRQIAVLRVLGASRSRIFMLVLIESIVIGVLGALVGVVLSLIAGEVVAVTLKQRLGVVVEPGFEPVLTLIIIGGAIALAALAGVIPAVLAYRTSVARNLRPIG